MRKENRVKGLLLGGAALSCFAMPQVAFAQGADDGETIIVTGSRIGRAGFDTLQPANQLDADFIDARGFANVADALNQMPAFGAAAGTAGASPNGGQGAQNLGQNFVNIFGLGSERTLTLINSRRAIGGNAPANGGVNAGLQVDLNIIPTSLISRIETIYTGGAPIYGSDAVAGTVNVILKDDFEGFEFDAQAGLSEHGDAEHHRVRTVIGGNFADGRGNAVVSAEYSRQGGLVGTDRPDITQGGNFCSTRASIFGVDTTAPTDGQPDSTLCEDGLSVWTVTNTGTPTPLNTFAGHPNSVNPSDTRANNLDVDGDGINDARSFLGSPNNFFRDANGNPWLFDVNGRDIITFDEANLGKPWQTFFSQGAGRNNPYVINLNDTNTLVSPLNRYIISGLGHYDLNDNIRVISEVLFTHSDATDELNQPQWSNAAFARNANLIIKTDNPYLTATPRALIEAQLPDRITDANRDGVNDSGPCGGAAPQPACVPDGIADLNVDTDADGIPDDLGFFLTRTNEDIFAGSASHRSQDTFRIVSGLEGDASFLDRDWSWESVFYFGQNNSSTDQTVINQTRYALALDSVIDPATGQIVCRAKIDPPVDPRQGNIISNNKSDVNNCVPINPLGFGNFDDNVRSYLVQNQFQTTQLQQLAVELNAAGELFDLPGGAVGVAMGFTHRRERGDFRVDQANAIDLPGRINQAASANKGGFNTTELYAETVIPIFGDDFSPLPFISGITAEGAIRFVDNSVAGEDLTWVAGGRANLDLPLLGEGGLQVRGNFTRTIRAPGILELFLPTSGGATFAQDPCDPRFIIGGPNPALRRANCEAEAARAGVDLTSFQSFIVNSSKPTIVGGNLNLNNEVADSWTVGGIIRPGFVPGLEMSVDWTHIFLTDAIVQISGTQLMNACYDGTDFPANKFCAGITRDAMFQATQLALPFENAAEREFAGLIGAATWNFAASDVPFIGEAPGDFSINGQFFHTHLHRQRVGTGDSDFFANENGGERGFEKFRYQLNLGYNTDRWNLLWQLNSATATTSNLDSSAEALSNPNSERSFRTHNFALRYRITDTLSGRFVINNVFDNTDNLLEQANAVGNNLQYRDAVGRRFVFGVNASF